LLVGCIQEEVSFVSEDLLENESTTNLLAGKLEIIGVIDYNPLGQFAASFHETDSNILNYTLRRCTYTEQSLYRDIRRPMVSIHSFKETPDRNKPLMVTYEDSEGYVETEYVPVATLLLTNKGDKKTGEIFFELNSETQGDHIIAYPKVASFGSVITKSAVIENTGSEGYFRLAGNKYYFYDQNENVVFADTNRLFNEEGPLRKGEIPLDDYLNLNSVSPLCDSALDYIVVDDHENEGKKKVPCKQTFSQFEIDTVEPKEFLSIDIYYYPYSRISYEQKYSLDPPSRWPLKKQQDGNVMIKVFVTYPDTPMEQLAQINLKMDLKEYTYDEQWDYCKPKNEE
jgi:hypothetical protein